MDSPLALPAVEAGSSLPGAPPNAAGARRDAGARGGAFQALLAMLLGAASPAATPSTLPDSAAPAASSDERATTNDQLAGGDPTQAALAMASLILPLMAPAGQLGPSPMPTATPSASGGAGAAGASGTTGIGGIGGAIGGAWAMWAGMGQIAAASPTGARPSTPSADGAAHALAGLAGIADAAPSSGLASPEAGIGAAMPRQGSAFPVPALPAPATSDPALAQAITHRDAASIARHQSAGDLTAPLTPALTPRSAATDATAATGIATPTTAAATTAPSPAVLQALVAEASPAPSKSPAPTADRGGSETAAPLAGVAAPAPTLPTIGAGPSEPARPAGVPLTANAVDEIVHQARLTAMPGRGSLRMRLEPAALGQVDVTIDLTRQGASVRLTAASAEARAAIEQQLPTLRHALESSGFGHQRLTLSAEVAAPALAGGGAALDLARQGLPQRQSAPWSPPSSAATATPAIADGDPTARASQATAGNGLIDYRA